MKTAKTGRKQIFGNCNNTRHGHYPYLALDVYFNPFANISIISIILQYHYYYHCYYQLITIQKAAATNAVWNFVITLGTAFLIMSLYSSLSISLLTKKRFRADLTSSAACSTFASCQCKHYTTMHSSMTLKCNLPRLKCQAKG